MTHTEALRQVLEELGGRAHLSEIYPRVVSRICFKEGSNIQATLRTALQRHPRLFKSSPNMPDGWWELVSYQEEISVRDQRIKELEDENRRLKAVPTEDDFVTRLVKKVKHNLKRDKKTVEEIRKLMDALGRSDADKELDEWLQGKPKPVVKQVTKNFIQKNINSQVFTGNVTESDFNAGGQGNE